MNVVIECYDMFKNRFPFSKPVAENNNYSGNAWDALYNAKKGTGSSGGLNNNPNPNNNWSNPSPPPNSGWGNPNAGWANQSSSGWNANNGNNWGGSNNAGWGGNTTSNWGNQPANNNSWGSQPPSNSWGAGNNPNSGWGNAVGGMGGMGGINNSNNSTANIASAQKLVGKQKQTLQQINGQYLKLIEKVQVLDATKQAL